MRSGEGSSKMNPSMMSRGVLIGAVTLAVVAAWESTVIHRLQRQNDELETSLRREISGCNDQVGWLERCLDGRTCTDNLPEIKIHRKFPPVVLPNRVVPWEQACMKASQRIVEGGY